jgi:DNA-binding IclR family transcriptional regulator
MSAEPLPGPEEIPDVAHRPGPVRIGGVDRVTRVLEYLVRADGAPTHGELSAELGIARSTLSDVLAELRVLGYVRLVERRYVLGPAMLSLCHRGARQTDIVTATRPMLEALARQSGETCVLSLEVAGEGLVVPVDQAEGSRRIHFHAHLGEPWALHFTGAGQALFAFSGRTAANLPPYDSRHGDEHFDPAGFDRELALVRERGYAMEIGTQEGHWSIAAAVRDSTGWPLAAISVVGPTERLRQSRHDIGRVLVEATERWRVPLGRIDRRTLTRP